ncbi:MAG: AmmeMemoRadiSam system protein B [Desulfococcus multivorans]|jgi:AmmeMemoRadiSam system protein B|nr:AmmeMemoRadiSam system protein B [Desulfococcus multivorans]
MNIRKAAFAGSWYPETPEACEREIRAFLGEGTESDLTGRVFVGGIVPHAGWYFSGSIACRVIHALSLSSPPDVIAVFGMHLHPGSPLYMMPEGAWETPFGALPVASDLAAALSERFSFTIETPTRFTPDNTIELQLPFIKYFFRDVRVIAVGAPPADTTPAVAETLVSLARETGLSLKVVGSTDLTHYGMNYGFTPKGAGPAALQWVTGENDRRFIEAVLAMDPQGIIREGVGHHNACCSGAAASAVAAAKALGARRGEALAYATSHDKHPGESFVGYVGVVFE